MALLTVSACSDETPKNRLVYLSSPATCEAGEPDFEKVDCSVLRKRDAVVILSIPNDWGGGERKSENPTSFSGDLILMPKGIVTLSDKEYKTQIKPAMRNALEGKNDYPVYVGSIVAVWGWWDAKLDEHAIVRQRMDANNLSFVEIDSRFPGFQAFESANCVSASGSTKAARAATSGSTAPCGWHNIYYLPQDDPTTSVTCQAPPPKEKVTGEPGGCKVSTSVVLKTDGSRQFRFIYSYAARIDWIENGFWRQIDQRVGEWIQQSDVTKVESSRGK